jgi:UDP-N-acetylglucosamine 4,6-dehydratase/5-epimerase
MNFNGKRVLITGGCGSFGQKFTEIILENHNPKSVRIYDNRELSEVEMERKFNDERLRFLVGDVRDKERMSRAMNGIDIVIHAAALKHVPICEYNPIEAVKTNIEGAVSVIDAAIDNKIEKVIAISTDKAVHPVNLYGATKMVSEKLFIQANSYSKGEKPIFSCSRYGNVVGSSGSVVPLFLKQKEKGEITITDEKMTRFWITLEEGVNFVINCVGRMKGGEIFVPKIPSMKIMELAEIIAPQTERKTIGIRPGEKLHEILLTEEEAVHSKEFDDFFVVEPQFPFWDRNNFNEGKKLSLGFKYTSDNNTQKLSKETINKLLSEIEIEK